MMDKNNDERLRLLEQLSIYEKQVDNLRDLIDQFTAELNGLTMLEEHVRSTLLKLLDAKQRQ